MEDIIALFVLALVFCILAVLYILGGIIRLIPFDAGGFFVLLGMAGLIALIAVIGGLIIHDW